MTRLLVDTDGASLGPATLLSAHVLGVGRSKDVESVRVVRSHDDQGLVELANLLQVLNGLSDRVVELQEFTERSVIVHGVEHLVDRGGLAHEQETLVTRSSVQDVDGLQGHFGESGLVDGGAVAEGRLGDVGQVLGEYFSVEPLRCRCGGLGQLGSGASSVGNNSLTLAMLD